MKHYLNKKMPFAKDSMFLFDFLKISFVCFRDINFIFSEVDKHIAEGDLITKLNLSALPTLFDHFVKLLNILVSF